MEDKKLTFLEEASIFLSSKVSPDITGLDKPTSQKDLIRDFLGHIRTKSVSNLDITTVVVSFDGVSHLLGVDFHNTTYLDLNSFSVEMFLPFTTSHFFIDEIPSGYIRTNNSNWSTGEKVVKVTISDITKYVVENYNEFTTFFSEQFSDDSVSLQFKLYNEDGSVAHAYGVRNLKCQGNLSAKTEFMCDYLLTEILL